MKTTLYKIAFMACLLPALSFCTNSTGSMDGKHTKQKKISKTYTVSANDILKIDNSYGNVDVSTWDQNTISIEVIVTTNGNDEEKVEQKLKDITVEFRQTSGVVSAKTHFPKENSSWWSDLFGGNNNVNMEVNYVIKAPVTNNLDIDNDYGNIIIDKLKGNASLNCDYGSIEVGELRGESNHLNFDYTRNCHFGYINKAVIDADYSEFTIEDANALDLRADYTNSNIMKTELLQFNCDYGSLKVLNVKKILGSGDYLATRIGQIYQSADLSMDYGSLSIEKVMKGAGNIKINTDYTGIKIGYARDFAFNFDVNASYGGISGVSDFQINKQIQNNSDKNYSGYYLQENSGGMVSINSSYGSISFQQK